MEDLVKAFFERDLDQKEEQELGGILSSSIEEAVRFDQLGAKFYADLGLPEPRWPDSKARPITLKGIGIGIMIGGAIVGSLAWWSFRDSKQPVMAVVEEKKEMTVTAPEIKKVKEEAPVDKGYDTGDALFVKVTLEKRCELAITIYSQDGRLVRDLLTGSFDTGSYRFPWDRLDNAGKSVPFGKYKVVVDAGDGKMEQWIEIKGKAY